MKHHECTGLRGCKKIRMGGYKFKTWGYNVPLHTLPPHNPPPPRSVATRLHTHIYIHIYTHTHTHILTYTHTHTYVRKYILMYTYYAYVCIHNGKNIHVNTLMYDIHIYRPIHTYLI